MSKPKRPKDTNQRAKLIIDIATGEKENSKPNESARGRAGGLKGGKARAKKLSKKRRVEIAKKAINERWKKKG